MALATAFSMEKDPAALAADLKAQLGPLEPSFVVFFASSSYDPAALGRALAAALGPVPSIGCSSAGEILSGKMTKGAVVLMAIDQGTLARVSTALVDEIGDETSVDAALARLAEGIGHPLEELDRERYLGLTLHDGLSLAEEATMEALSARTNVPFVGGSAGDDLAFQATHVFIDFVPHRGASVLALLEPRNAYSILKTQSFDVLEPTFVVTDVDEKTRTVRSFNGEPAATAYAKAIGVPVAELPSRFSDHPLGLLVGEGDPFVRSPQRIDGENVVFYCQVKEGMELSLLRARDIVDDTRRDLQGKLSESGPVAGILNFHCILRTLELERKGACDAYGALFADVPTIGFSTYGESYIGHINQTSTMVLLK